METMNDPEIQKIPEGSIISEEMVEEYREMSAVTDENGQPVNRDVAISTLLAFEAGEGMPKTALFNKFPALGAAYFAAVAAKNGATTVSEEGGEIVEPEAEAVN